MGKIEEVKNNFAGEWKVTSYRNGYLLRKNCCAEFIFPRASTLDGIISSSERKIIYKFLKAAL